MHMENNYVKNITLKCNMEQNLNCFVAWDETCWVCRKLFETFLLGRKTNTRYDNSVNYLKINSWCKWNISSSISTIILIVIIWSNQIDKRDDTTLTNISEWKYSVNSEVISEWETKYILLLFVFVLTRRIRVVDT